MILRGVLACVRCPAGGRVRRFYTFDHCRLWCMHMADCKKVRVEVVLSGPSSDEMASKADGLGCPVHELEVRSVESSKAMMWRGCARRSLGGSKHSLQQGGTGCGIELGLRGAMIAGAGLYSRAPHLIPQK